MAHWAEIDEAGVVLRVIVCDADDEADGAKHPPAFCSEVLGGTWARTYYDTKGETFAGVGYSWDGQAFTAPDPVLPTADDVVKAIALLEDQAILTTEEADKAREAAGT